jgi:tetratricopeptide (TPR) repeat protein
MFFTRLRRHAKWMFVLLALIFGGGFIIFGIGSDQGTGIGDILRDSGGATNNSLSVSDAREQLQASPGSPQAQRNLATALQADGQTDEAIPYLTRYVAQRPKDADALRELASLHLTRGIAKAQEAQAEQLRASYLTFGTTFGGSLELGEGKTLGPDPIDEAISTKLSQSVNAAYASAQQSFTAAEQTYDKLVLAVPDDPNVRLELAQAAQQSGNYPKAITAYEQFLKLAPDDPSAPLVKQQITQLKQAQAQTGTG